MPGRRIANDISEKARENGGQGVSKQQEIDEAPAHRLAGDHRIVGDAETEHDQNECRGGKQPRAKIVNEASTPQPHALQSNDNGEEERDVEPCFGEREPRNAG